MCPFWGCPIFWIIFYETKNIRDKADVRIFYYMNNGYINGRLTCDKTFGEKNYDLVVTMRRGVPRGRGMRPLKSGLKEG